MNVMCPLCKRSVPAVDGVLAVHRVPGDSQICTGAGQRLFRLRADVERREAREDIAKLHGLLRDADERDASLRATLKLRDKELETTRTALRLLRIQARARHLVFGVEGESRACACVNCEDIRTLLDATAMVTLPSDRAECRICHKRFRHPAPGTGGTWTCSDACRQVDVKKEGI